LIVWVVKYTLQVPDGTTGVEETLSVIHALLEQDLAQVGDAVVVEGRVEITPWRGSATNVTKRIRSEWTALGRSPTLGEVCWLILTERGRTVAQRARESSEPEEAR